MRLAAYSATERGIMERRQRAPVYLSAPEVKSEPAPARIRASDNVVSLVIPRAPMQELIIAIAHKHGLTYADIIGPRRFRNIVAARVEAVLAVKDARPCLTVTQIGRMFHKDHSSIVHMLRK